MVRYVRDIGFGMLGLWDLGVDRFGRTANAEVRGGHGGALREAKGSYGLSGHPPPLMSHEAAP